MARRSERDQEVKTVSVSVFSSWLTLVTSSLKSISKKHSHFHIQQFQIHRLLQRKLLLQYIQIEENHRKSDSSLLLNVIAACCSLQPRKVHIRIFKCCLRVFHRTIYDTRGSSHEEVQCAVFSAYKYC